MCFSRPVLPLEEKYTTGSSAVSTLDSPAITRSIHGISCSWVRIGTARR
jgi:hypothetical protein